ncbi:MAG: biotin--[acetyl-CoA-carboxylase] ligase [Chloroflexi bacterium]|nr:biotin--[acetyl-CoA-carboxylase] ligase [Chloroflexota bacterium]
MRQCFSPVAILNGLNTRLIGQNVLFYPTLGSTNDMAGKMAGEGMSEGTVVATAEQTAGRGRQGRKWFSARDSAITLSVILRPDRLALPQLNMVAGLTVVRCIERMTNLKPVIKWPNDVLLNGRKVSGVLMENVFEGGKLRAAIVGIGINVRLDVSSFPEIAPIATSLSTELGRDMSPWEMLPCVIEEFDRSYQELLARGRFYIHEEWLASVETIGKMVRVTSGNIVEQGCAQAIDVDGNITLRRADGSSVTLVTGEQ